MFEDIFVPKSTADDALVSPLHTTTYVTGDRSRLDTILREGYGLTASDWFQPTADEFAALNPYLGFDDNHRWEACRYFKSGEGSNGRIRVIHVHQETPAVRPSYEGLYTGGATISFPIADLRAHETHMRTLGVESTIGVKDMEFASPTGETYVSSEIVYKAPDNAFLLGVTRPDIFIPVGPMDAATGLGGPAYSARCVAKADATSKFLVDVLGYEIRRDVAFEVDDNSAINLPEGVTERFIQAFAPGSSSGYLVLMDHGKDTRYSPAPGFGPPNRGIGIWSFHTAQLDDVHERAVQAGVTIHTAPAEVASPFLDAGRVMMMEDPDGFCIEVFES